MTETPQNTVDEPQVYKEEEFTLMCTFIRNGLWRTSNLSQACSVDRQTIDRWKKRPEAQAAYREVVEEIAKKRKKVGDPEKIMKELHLEVDRTELDITTLGLPILGGQSNVHGHNGNQKAPQAPEAD